MPTELEGVACSTLVVRGQDLPEQPKKQLQPDYCPKEAQCYSQAAPSLHYNNHYYINEVTTNNYNAHYHPGQIDYQHQHQHQPSHLNTCSGQSQWMYSCCQDQAKAAAAYQCEPAAALGGPQESQVYWQTHPSADYQGYSPPPSYYCPPAAYANEPYYQWSTAEAYGAHSAQHQVCARGVPADALEQQRPAPCYSDCCSQAATTPPTPASLESSCEEWLTVAQVPFGRKQRANSKPEGKRKNANKEVTSTLRCWLINNSNNPYPSKLEKLFMTCGTNMSLTQVSTWFANARRRMKKERLRNCGQLPAEPTSGATKARSRCKVSNCIKIKKSSIYCSKYEPIFNSVQQQQQIQQQSHQQQYHQQKYQTDSMMAACSSQTGKQLGF